MRHLKQFVRSFVPDSALSLYHLALAEFAALIYRYPSRHMLVIAVTGTKGKSSVTEMINVILEAAHYRTAVINSIRFKIGDESIANETRMSMPGRFFIQRFLRRAYRDDCDAVILEMTSEGARQHRHRGIALDALVFTNLAPEHIESHGSLEAYANAKFEIGRALARSAKHERIMVANADDPQSARYLALPVEKTIPFSLSEAQPWEATSAGGFFTFESQKVSITLPGEFSLKNALAAAVVTHALGIDIETIATALASLRRIPGRAEEIREGQDFAVVVDYAHTPDSLQAIYDAYGDKRKICVLGSTGGGRDTWKRPVMAGIADMNCQTVILTDEDPYDEDPRAIVEELARGMKRTPTIIMDRRAAIMHALSLAQRGDAVIVTGKGTDPNIARADGKKEPWSDAQVVRESLQELKV